MLQLWCQILRSSDLRGPSADASARRGESKDAVQLGGPPNSHGEGAVATVWDGLSGRFHVVSDCKPLVEILNGHSLLLDMSLAPPLLRVTKHIAGIFDAGLRPCQLHRDPVEWHRREFNKKADHLVNHTMDQQRTWHEESKAPPGVSLMNANFVMHFDGGIRGESCSAIAWILEAHSRHQGETAIFPVAMVGTVFSSAISSFLAELLALESCIVYFHEFVLRISSADMRTKRARVS